MANRPEAVTELRQLLAVPGVTKAGIARALDFNGTRMLYHTLSNTNGNKGKTPEYAQMYRQLRERLEAGASLPPKPKPGQGTPAPLVNRARRTRKSGGPAQVRRSRKDEAMVRRVDRSTGEVRYEKVDITTVQTEYAKTVRSTLRRAGDRPVRVYVTFAEVIAGKSPPITGRNKMVPLFEKGYAADKLLDKASDFRGERQGDYRRPRGLFGYLEYFAEGQEQVTTARGVVRVEIEVMGKYDSDRAAGRTEQLEINWYGDGDTDGDEE